MKKLITFIVLFVCSIFISSVSSYAEENEIIPFHPDPSLVTEWDVSVQGYELVEVVFDTPILKVIIPNGTGDRVLSFVEVYRTDVSEGIIWIFSEEDSYTQIELEFTDTYLSTLWLGGSQSVEPIMHIVNFSMDEYSQIEYIYLYPDSIINIVNDTNIYSYNFEYELNLLYQSGYDDGYNDGYDDGYDAGYDDGCGEKNDEPFLTSNEITKLMIALVIYIVALFVGMLIKSKLLLAMSGLLWLIPLVTINNFIIRIFCIIMLIISLMILLKERDDYYYD